MGPRTSLATMEKVSSGRNAFYGPTAAWAETITKPIVQPVRAPLPEFEAQRLQYEAAPVGGSRDFFPRVFPLDLGPFLFELRPVSNNAALVRCPRPDAAPARAALKIGVRFSRGDLAHLTFNANLSFQMRPIKSQGCSRVVGQVQSFVTVIIGIKNEPSLINPFEEHYPHRRPALL